MHNALFAYIEGVGAGVEVAKKAVGVGSDAWDLYRKIRVD
jgi:hypothetical protein